MFPLRADVNRRSAFQRNVLDEEPFLGGSFIPQLGSVE